MPALGEKKNPAKSTAKQEPEEFFDDVKTREQVIDFSSFEDEKEESAGYTFGFYGLTKTGKSCTAYSLANLRKEMIPAWEEDYPLCAKALREGLIPEINRVIFIDTENAFKKQKNQLEQKRLFKYIDGRVEFLYKPVPIQIPNSDLEDLKKGMTISAESAKQIYEDVDLVENIIRWAKENSDENTLVIFDSASKYLDLVAAKGTIQYDMRISQKGKDAVKDEGYHKWEMRKMWWDATLGMLRGTPGWIVSTFRVVPNSDYSIAISKQKGREPVYTKDEALKTTGFALDMEYDFDFGETKFTRHVSIRNGRWVDEQDDDNNKFIISKTSRFSSLKLIESMLEVMMSEEMFADDNRDFELPALN